MAFYDLIGQKINEKRQEAYKHGKNMAETVKINSLISDEEKNIDKMCTEIGKLYIDIYQGNYHVLLQEKVDEVNDAYDRIEEYKRQLSEATGTIVCQNCGCTISNKSIFCSNCGARVEVEKGNRPVNTRRCPSCDTIVEDDDIFCIECGLKLPPVIPQKNNTSQRNDMSQVDDVPQDNGSSQYNKLQSQMNSGYDHDYESVRSATGKGPIPEGPIDLTTKLSPMPEGPMDGTTKPGPIPEGPMDGTIELSSKPEGPIERTIELNPIPEELIDRTTELSPIPEAPIDGTTELSPKPEEPMDGTTELNQIPEGSIDHTTKQSPIPEVPDDWAIGQEPIPEAPTNWVTEQESIPDVSEKAGDITNYNPISEIAADAADEPLAVFPNDRLSENDSHPNPADNQEITHDLISDEYAVPAPEPDTGTIYVGNLNIGRPTYTSEHDRDRSGYVPDYNNTDRPEYTSDQDADRTVKIKPRFCKVCGSSLDPDEIFCIKCGTKTIF